MKQNIFFLCLISAVSWAGVEEEFADLGGNQILLQRAQELSPETKVEIIQDRLVNRNHRWEVAPEFSGSFGGDTYSKTQSLGFNVQYHINPHWSVGGKLNYSFNKLTADGEAMVDRAYDDFLKNPKNSSSPVPDIDYQKNESLALVNWYPIYGKMNLLDRGIAHFDVYALLGAGQVQLRSGSTGTYTLGGGFGFWITQNFSTRLEMRYQRYKAQYFNESKNLDLAIASLQMGWLL